ncbi:hypothetical protein B0H16DRAFT_557438 [Mycena metata]|uniref:FBD domain-containing protein n=1 Tax=Mycena metata TaxID=1033252 RepID=A0AAD7JEW4_9AGAR|nr:hypothetical protein B0H16DRAFT_557438 [Mycena metata]
MESRGDRAAVRKGQSYLTVDCFVPRGYPKFLHAEIRRILDLCPRLVHLGLAPPFGIRGLSYSLPAMSSSSLTSLEFNHFVPHSAILPCLIQLATTLKTLALCFPRMDETYPILTFNNLEDLRLQFRGSSGSIHFKGKWRAPNLQRLSLFCLDGWNLWNEFGMVVAEYGGSIKFLQLYSRSPGYELFKLLDMCSVLEHLAVFPDGQASASTYTLAKLHSKGHRHISRISQRWTSASNCCGPFSLLCKGFRKLDAKVDWDSMQIFEGRSDITEFTDPNSVNGRMLIEDDPND